MKQLVIFILAIAVLVGGWMLLTKESTVTYVADVQSEVTALESELAQLEADIEAGTLTPEEAAEAQVRIVARINAINESIEKSDRAELTPEQRTQLMGGLERLKGVLVNYQSTLVTVDATVAAMPAAERPKLNVIGGRGRGNNVGLIMADIIATVEDYAEEVIADYEPEDTIPESVTVEAYEEAVIEVSDPDPEMSIEEEGTASDDGTTETGDAETEIETSAEADATEDDSDMDSSEDATDDSSVEADAELDAEVETTL